MWLHFGRRSNCLDRPKGYKRMDGDCPIDNCWSSTSSIIHLQETCGKEIRWVNCFKLKWLFHHHLPPKQDDLLTLHNHHHHHDGFNPFRSKVNGTTAVMVCPVVPHAMVTSTKGRQRPSMGWIWKDQFETRRKDQMDEIITVMYVDERQIRRNDFLWFGFIWLVYETADDLWKLIRLMLAIIENTANGSRIQNS